MINPSTQQYERTSMFLESVFLFTLAISFVISTALLELFWERSHLGDSGINLEAKSIQKKSFQPKKSLKPHDYTEPRASPVVNQEAEVWSCDGHLQPAPVSDEVGHEGQDEDTDAEEHLKHHSYWPSVLHSHQLSNWEQNRRSMKLYIAKAFKQRWIYTPHPLY